MDISDDDCNVNPYLKNNNTFIKIIHIYKKRTKIIISYNFLNFALFLYIIYLNFFFSLHIEIKYLSHFELI